MSQPSIEAAGAGGIKLDSRKTAHMEASAVTVRFSGSQTVDLNQSLHIQANLGVHSMSDHLPREARLTAEVISAQALYG